MHVMSKYIDTYRATVAALEDYVAMQHILQTTDQAIKDKAEKLYWFNIPAPEGMPPVRTPKAGEDRIAAGTDRVDAYQQRYAQAREYMDWFLSSWGTLGEDDRFVLDTFFFAADDVSQEIGCGRWLTGSLWSAPPLTPRSLARYADSPPHSTDEPTRLRVSQRADNFDACTLYCGKQSVIRSSPQ